jgi:hypothetical protein
MFTKKNQPHGAYTGPHADSLAPLLRRESVADDREGGGE